MMMRRVVHERPGRSQAVSDKAPIFFPPAYNLR
jgi:hypothetical protein